MSNTGFLKPRALRHGDVIGVVAPAWSFDPENFKRGVDKLCRLGFKLKYSQNIFKRYWSMAGYDRQRADLINRMFADKDVRAIFCAKAGYGSMRTIPYLDKKTIARNPKIFVGYSDITALLMYLSTITRAVVFHGPVISGEIHEDMNPSTLRYLLSVLTRGESKTALRFDMVKCLKPGKASGLLSGGNMSIIMSLMGTPYEIDTRGKILFLEDIGEGLETIDEYLLSLKFAGKLKYVKGIVFGRMVKCIDHSGKKYTVRHILNDILSDIKVPVVYGFPSGHRAPGDINVTLPLGIHVTLDADNARLIIDEPAVS